MADKDDVKEILDTDLDDPEITPYVDQAGRLVNDGTVQTYLAAHLIRMTRDQETESESVGDHSVEYSGETGLGLDLTRYGQMAQLFDEDNELPTAHKQAQMDISSW